MFGRKEERKTKNVCMHTRRGLEFCVSDNNIVIPVGGSSSEGKGLNPGLGRGSLFSIIDDEFSRCMHEAAVRWEALHTQVQKGKLAWQDTWGWTRQGDGHVGAYL